MRQAEVDGITEHQHRANHSSVLTVSDDVPMELSTADELDRMRSHWWWRPGWAVGRRMLTFHLTMEQAPAVREFAAQAREALTGIESQDRVPDRGLHLTMTGIGFEDEVTPQQLEDVSAEVFEHWSHMITQLPAPVLRFDSLFVAHESVMLLAEPDSWLEELARIQRSAVDRVMGAQEWGMFWPHLSVAYCNGPADPAPVIEALAPVAASAPERLEATPTLTLMRLGRDEHEYRWDVLRQVLP